MASLVKNQHRGGALLSPRTVLENAVAYPMFSSSLSPGKVASSSISEATPGSVDYRGFLGKPRDQGNQSSCVGFASAAILEYYAYRLYGRDVEFSAQFIYNCRTTEGDGMFPSEAMNGLYNWGCVLEASYPYGKNKSQKYRDMPAAVKTEALQWRSGQPNILRDVNSVKSAVANNGPCIMAFTCYNEGRYPWRKGSSDKTEIYGHCLAIVGYDATGFILRNSWGAGWADGGYTRMDFSEWVLDFETWTIPDGSDSARPTSPPPLVETKKDKKGCCEVM